MNCRTGLKGYQLGILPSIHRLSQPYLATSTVGPKLRFGGVCTD
jgi:hypothetical protein